MGRTLLGSCKRQVAFFNSSTSGATLKMEGFTSKPLLKSFSSRRSDMKCGAIILDPKFASDNKTNQSIQPRLEPSRRFTPN